MIANGVNHLLKALRDRLDSLPEDEADTIKLRAEFKTMSADDQREVLFLMILMAQGTDFVRNIISHFAGEPAPEPAPQPEPAAPEPADSAEHTLAETTTAAAEST